MKSLGFIDPFMHSPAVNCFNGIIELLGIPTNYHMPSKFGINGLLEHQSETGSYIVVGSTSHVTEPLEWHKPLAAFLLSELKRGKPVLACCFGHQLLCHALGSEVEFAYASKEKFSGIREITFHQDFEGFQKGECLTLPVSHRQIVTTLGPGLKEVGRGLSNDIVIHEGLPLLSTQTHPEASEYFCSSEIQNLNDDDIQRGRKDGAILIRRFFKSIGAGV